MTALFSLETVFTGQAFADVAASPLQLAVCRAADGTAQKLASQSRFFGCATLPTKRPRLIALVCGVRGGKSFLAACAAIVGALTADCSRLKAFEVPRYAIIAPRTDVADATFLVLRGIVEASPILRRFLDGEPTSDTLVLKRPDGQRVEIKVVAASSGGITVRNRWLAGFCLEEVAQFGIEAGGAAVNADQILKAARSRLLPGAQGWLVSSPFGPQGLLYETWEKHFGRPKPGGWLVVHAGTRDLNPSYPQADIDALRAEDPDTAAREHDAAWTDAEIALLASQAIMACTRADEKALPRIEGASYVSATDPATRNNAWTIVIGTKTLEAGVVVVAARQWQGSKVAPLDPAKVFAEMKLFLAPYGVTTVETDGWSGDSLRSLAMTAGLHLVIRHLQGGDNWENADALRLGLLGGRVSLPANDQMRSDLAGAKRRITSSGPKLHLPKTADGRHCDYFPSVALVHHRANLLAPWSPPAPVDEAKRLENIAIRQYQKRDKPWQKRRNA